MTKSVERETGLEPATLCLGTSGAAPGDEVDLATRPAVHSVPLLCCRHLPQVFAPVRYLHYTTHLTQDPVFGHLSLPAQLMYLKLPVATHPADGRRFYADPGWLHWLLFASDPHVDVRTIRRALAELRAHRLVGPTRASDRVPDARIEGWLWDHVAEIG